MIVCICKRARDTDIAEAISEGASSVDDVARACGAGTGCGSCREHIHKMLRDAGATDAEHVADCPGRQLPLAS